MAENAIRQRERTGRAGPLEGVDTAREAPGRRAEAVSAVRSIDRPSPAECSPRQRFEAVMDTHGMWDEELDRWCMTQGVSRDRLEDWRREIADSAAVDAYAELQRLREENRRLREVLRRKSKALDDALGRPARALSMADVRRGASTGLRQGGRRRRAGTIR